MLQYEFKKILGTKKTIVLFSLFVVSAIYATILMLKAPDDAAISGLPVFSLYMEAQDLCYFMLLFISTVLAASLFPAEDTNNMTELMMTSNNGKSKLPLTKIVTAFIVSNSMTLIFILIVLLGYIVVFGTDFGILVTEGRELEYTIDPDIRTFGNVIVITLIGVFVRTNFIVISSMLISLKLKKAFPTIVVVYGFCYAIAFIPDLNIPVLDTLVNLSPMCLGVRAATYKELFSLGSISITALDIGFVVYIILTALLILRVKSAYKTK